MESEREKCRCRRYKEIQRSKQEVEVMMKEEIRDIEERRKKENEWTNPNRERNVNVEGMRKENEGK